MAVHSQILLTARSDSNWYLKRSFAYEQLKRWTEAEADIQSALQCLAQWQPSDERKKARRLRVAHASLARIAFAQAQTLPEFERALGMCLGLGLGLVWVGFGSIDRLRLFPALFTDCCFCVGCDVVWCGVFLKVWWIMRCSTSRRTATLWNGAA